MKSRFFSLTMWVLFAAGLVGGVDGKHLVHGAGHQHLLTFGGIALSMAAGSYVMRQEPLKSLLKTRPALWFLFLFNLAIAVAAPFLMHGSQGIGTAAGMGVVSLGAGMGLLKSRTASKPAHARTAPVRVGPAPVRTPTVPVRLVPVPVPVSTAPDRTPLVRTAAGTCYFEAPVPAQARRSPAHRR